MTWHLNEELLASYRRDELEWSLGASVEAHVLGCAHCREAIATSESTASVHGRLDRTWNDIRDVIDRPRMTGVETLLVRLRVRPSWARLLAATPALHASWLLGFVALVGFALGCALVADVAGRDGRLVFLLVAPVLPLVLVGFAYGPRVDPAYELAAATPMAGPRLLLLRTVTAVVPAIAVCTVATVAAPGPVSDAVLWLLPAFTLVTGSLALSTRIPLAAAAAVLAVGWAIVVLMSFGSTTVLFGPIAQVAYAVVGVACVLIWRVRVRRTGMGGLG